MKEFISTFFKVYAIGFGVILLLVLALASENVQKFELIHVVVVVLGTVLSTALLVYVSIREEKKCNE